MHRYRSVPHGANSSLLRTLHTPWYTPSRVGEHQLSASPTIVVVFLSPGRNPPREKERKSGTEWQGERSIFILFPVLIEVQRRVFEPARRCQDLRKTEFIHATKFCYAIRLALAFLRAAARLYRLYGREKRKRVARSRRDIVELYVQQITFRVLLRRCSVAENVSPKCRKYVLLCNKNKS